MKSNPETRSLCTGWTEVLLRLPSDKLHLVDLIMEQCFATRVPPTVAHVSESLNRHPDIRHKYDVSALGIFGSVARGTAKASSDIDVLVVFNDPPGLNQLSLRIELQELLGWPVDLVTLTSIGDRFPDPAALDRILKEVIYVWKDEHNNVH